MPSPGTTTGLSVTANAFQSTTDGKDFYVATFMPNATGIFYATFFGENGGTAADHLDGGTCRIDKNGILYHAACASCGGSNAFPTTGGAYSSTNNSSNCNAAAFKMAIASYPSANMPAIFPNTGCAPFQVCFSNAGSSASNFIWDFGDGGTSTQPSPCYTYSVAGSYTVTLFAIDSIGICGYLDTAQTTITVLSCTGVEELNQSDVTLYPNPTSGLITISHPKNTSKITVRDVLGREVYYSNVPLKNHYSLLDLSQIPIGLYFIEIQSINGHSIRKLVRE